MTPADLVAADRLRAQVGFNQRVDDWLNLLRWEPHGCFVAESSGTVVGTVTTTTFDRRLAWVGMLLVDEAHRRRSLGSQLLQVAMSSVPDVSCIALDATPAGRELYLRRGFRDRVPITRWHGTVVGGAEAAPSAGMLPMVAADLADVVALDRAVTGVDRTRVLGELARHPGCWTVRRDGQLLGFAMTRPGSLHHVVGPLVAPDRATAWTLVQVALARLVGRSVVMDVPDVSQIGPRLRRHGLAPQRPLIRMSTADLPSGQLDGGYHAIASPEIG